MYDVVPLKAPEVKTHSRYLRPHIVSFIRCNQRTHKVTHGHGIRLDRLRSVARVEGMSWRQQEQKSLNLCMHTHTVTYSYINVCTTITTKSR